jgi:dTDP-4-amino-4,6-dideoxygalactose transaminase
MDPLHLFVPTFHVDEALAEVRECLERGWTGLGFKTVAFEEAWRAYSGLPHAHFLSSATAGLHLAVRLLKEQEGWREGDEVVTTPLTFVSTNHVLLYEDLRPVFADVADDLCLDPQSVEDRIGPRTRAVMFVGLGGNAGRYAEVLEICRRRGLRLILDGAHMAGSWLGERHAGHDADAAVFSFQAVKNLPTADAGAVCFADARLDAEARKWSWLGISADTYTRTLGQGRYRWHYDVEHVGFKYHGNSVMAALALVGLRHLEEDNERRRRLAAAYDTALAGLTGVERIAMTPGCRPSRHLYQVLVEGRDEVMVRLNAEGIYPGVHYRDNTLYRMYAHASGSCPRARRASERLISLPLHLRMTEADTSRVAEALSRSQRFEGV